MAASLNKVTLIGNLGKDPEIRYAPDGSKIVQFSLATGESWKDKVTGERKDRTEWHRVVIFNDRLGDICEKYIKKGSKVYVEGQLQTRKWTDNSGQEKFSTEVVISRFKGELVILDARSSNGGESSYSSSDYDRGTNDGPSSVLDDDIPF